jgi:hypothetical protein
MPLPFSLLQKSSPPDPHKNSILLFGTAHAITKARRDEKEDTKMKTSRSKQGAYAGAGAGLVLFGLFGLLPGSLVGGAMGIAAAGMLFGLPLEPGLLSRVIVLGSMLLGVAVSGIMITTAHNASAAAEGR